MREKQLAQEAKKLDAKVGGTKSSGLEETWQRIRRGWSKWKGDGKLEPIDHPEGLRLTSKGMERGDLGGDSQARTGAGLLSTIKDILRLHLGAGTISIVVSDDSLPFKCLALDPIPAE